MKFINDHIKRNEFKHVYLIHGEESYLIKQYKDKLKSAIIGDDEINYTYYIGKKLDIKNMLQMADTMPFFAERRLIIVEDSSLFKSTVDEVADLIRNIPEYLYIVFVDNEIDKRSKLYKAVKDKGYISEMKYQDTSVLCKWIVGMLAAENKKIDKAALELFISKTGIQMDNIKAEIEKLICYKINDTIITDKDVEAVCTTQTTSRIFDMVTAIAMKRQKQALDLYYDLLLLKEPPMRIMFLITRQFNMMLQVKEMINERYDNAYISKQLGIASFLVGKYISQAKSFTLNEIKNALEDCVQTEENVKTGKLDDKMGVELIIIKYSSKN